MTLPDINARAMMSFLRPFSSIVLLVFLAACGSDVPDAPSAKAQSSDNTCADAANCDGDDDNEAEDEGAEDEEADDKVGEGDEPDDTAAEKDDTGDGILSDRDGDGVLDDIDDFPDDPHEWNDTDGDGVGDNADPDIDGDGYVNVIDDFPHDAGEWIDIDGDGIGDNADPDIDGDGVPNEVDVAPYDPRDGGNVAPMFENPISELACSATLPVEHHVEVSDANISQAPTLSMTSTCRGFALSGTTVTGTCPIEDNCVLELTADDGWATTTTSITLAPTDRLKAWVSPTSRGTGDGSSWANATDDPQAIINSAGLPLWLHVEQGSHEWSTALTIPDGKTVLLEGGYVQGDMYVDPTTDPALTALTVSTGRVLQVLSGGELRLRHVRVTGGRRLDGSSGAGLHAAGPVTLERVQFVDNGLALSGPVGIVAGGAAVYASAPLVILDSLFAGNHVDFDSSCNCLVAVDGGIVHAASDLVLENVTFRQNTVSARSDDVDGNNPVVIVNGSVLLADASLQADGVLVLDNTAHAPDTHHARMAGTVMVAQSSPGVVMRRSRLQGNMLSCTGTNDDFSTCRGMGAGLYVNRSHFELEDNVFAGNTISTAAKSRSEAVGGGANLEVSQGTVFNNLFIGNRLDANLSSFTYTGPDFTANGGGLAFSSPYSVYDYLLLHHNTFYGNIVEDAQTTRGGNFANNASEGRGLQVYNNVFLAGNGKHDGSWTGGPRPLHYGGNCGETPDDNAEWNFATPATDDEAVVIASGRVYLTGDSACVDQADITRTALVYGEGDWHGLTTHIAGITEAQHAEGGTILPDAGAHYDPETVSIISFEAYASGASWATSGATACRLQPKAFSPSGPLSIEVPPAQLPLGGMDAADLIALGYGSGAEFDLVCFDDGRGTVALARATVE